MRVGDSAPVISALTIRQRSLGHIQNFPTRARANQSSAAIARLPRDDGAPAEEPVPIQDAPVVAWRCRTAGGRFRRLRARPESSRRSREHARHGLVVKQLIDADFCPRSSPSRRRRTARSASPTRLLPAATLSRCPPRPAKRRRRGKKNAIDLDADADEATAAPSQP